METLTCPKCQGPMRTYERNGVHVDQCSECRGIFLDRGELERLMDAEEAYHAPSAAPPPRQQAAPQGGQLGAIVGEVMRQAGGGSKSSHGYPHKKKSLLGELFG
jgi:Zn-finger nucleic acid-binding protein